MRMLWKFNGIYNPARQLADHRRPVHYAMHIPAAGDNGKGASRDLYILRPEPSRTTSVPA
jgi:magnesium-protoporphyrin IX monomethyl ester (oxidative) cyclase